MYMVLRENNRLNRLKSNRLCICMYIVDLFKSRFNILLQNMSDQICRWFKIWLFSLELVNYELTIENAIATTPLGLKQ